MSTINGISAEINELSPPDGPAPVMRALEAQRLLDLIALKVMPAVAAGLITYLHLGAASYGLLMAATMLIALQLVERCATAARPDACGTNHARAGGAGSRRDACSGARVGRR